MLLCGQEGKHIAKCEGAEVFSVLISLEQALQRDFSTKYVIMLGKKQK